MARLAYIFSVLSLMTSVSAEQEYPLEADLLSPEDRDYSTLKVIKDSKDGKATIKTGSGNIEIEIDVNDPEMEAKRDFDRASAARKAHREKKSSPYSSEGYAERRDSDLSEEKDVAFSAQWSWGEDKSKQDGD